MQPRSQQAHWPGGSGCGLFHSAVPTSVTGSKSMPWSDLNVVATLRQKAGMWSRSGM